MKKYKLIKSYKKGLYRVKSLIDFNNVKKDDIGGYVEREKNLSHFDDAWVYDNAKVTGNAEVSGNAGVFGGEDYIVFKNFWTSKRYFTFTFSNKLYKVGCFLGTGDELIKKAYQDSEISGSEYERVVKYVNSILKDRENENTNKENKK